MSNTVSVEKIEKKICLIRGQRVMLDFDLAVLYGTETKQLKRQVNRNISRFPDDFMFQLSDNEHDSLRCQIGTLKRGQHSKYLPYAFTEQGIAMLSSVLNSERAIQVNITIMRIFVKIKQILIDNKDLANKILLLEKKMEKYDSEILTIFEAIRQLMIPPEKSKGKIGFVRE